MDSAPDPGLTSALARLRPDSGPARLEGVRRTLTYSKKDLLLFRHVRVMGLDRQLGEAFNDPALVADCEYLIEKGFLVPGPDDLREAVEESLVVLGLLLRDHYDDETKEWTSPSAEDFGVLLVQLGLLHEGMAVAGVSEDERAGVLQNTASTVLPDGAEFIHSFLANIVGCSTVPLRRKLLSTREMARLTSVMSAAHDIVKPTLDTGVIDLVVRNLPVPGDNVSLDAILEFVSDEETQRRLLGLHLWTRRAAISGRELHDLALEMDEMLHEFTSHMRVLDLAQNTSGFRVALSLPIGVLEELLRLRPKKALDVVFDYRDRRATRLEKELSSPGNAVAYIYEAKEHFRS